MVAEDIPLLLQMRGIRKVFPGAVALDDVSFELRRGEVHALLGENGAGKSTLMKILSGACRRDGGEILIDGRPFALESPREAQALGISTIYQEFNLVPHLSVADNVYLGREPVRKGVIDRRAATVGAEVLLRSLGTSIDPEARVQGGRRRRSEDGELRRLRQLSRRPPAHRRIPGEGVRRKNAGDESRRNCQT